MVRAVTISLSDALILPLGWPNMNQFLNAIGAYTLSNQIEIKSTVVYLHMLGSSLLTFIF